MNTPLYIHAPIELAASPDAGLPRRFSGVAYSGARIDNWHHPVVIDLAATRVDPAIPLLYQHDHAAVIGAITEAANDGASLAVAGELFSDIDDQAASVAKKSARGARYQMSVGIFGARAEDLAPGAALAINGQSVTGPITILRGGTVREVSIVAIGADSHTNAAFFDLLGARPRPTPEAQPMPDAPDTAALEARIAELTAAAEAATARAEAAESALAAERQAIRLAAVRDLFAALGREFSETAAAPYLTMSSEVFAAVASDLKAARPAPPAHLFREQATGEPSPEPVVKLNAADIYAARRIA